MKEIKLDAFSLFVILLVVLVISMVFINWFFVYPSSFSRDEGFVSFQNNKSALEYVNIPQYSSTKTKIAKIYDNIFLDTENGNLIEVDSTTYTNASDSSGSSIRKIWITGRDNAGNPVTSYNAVVGANGVIRATDTSESIKKFANSMTPYIYKSNSAYTARNYVIYVPYNDTTFLHTITISNESINPITYKHSNSIVYSHPTMSGQVKIRNTISGAIHQLSGSPIQDTDVSNNSLVILPLYDPSQNVFQMSHNTFFNPLNGHFIIKSMSNNSPVIRVYNRLNRNITTTYKTTNKETTIQNVVFTSWNRQDISGNKICVYLGDGMKTIIMIIEPTTDNASFQIFKVYRFGANGTLDTELARVSSPIATSEPPKPAIEPPISTINPPPLDKDSISDYYKWYWYWNTNGGSDMNKNYSEDYLLKTQIIPPVCPSCPMCPSGGTCTNCNGIGGSGISQDAINGNVLGKGNVLYKTGSGVTRIGENVVNGTVGIGKDVVGGTVGLGKEVVGGTVGLGKEVVGGTVGLGKEIVGSTIGLGKEVVGGAVGLGKEVVGGTVGLVKDAASGILNAGRPVQLNDMNRSGYNNSYGGQTQGSTTQSAVTDQYSYYGARPVTGSTNYMPITADFSKFGR